MSGHPSAARAPVAEAGDAVRKAAPRRRRPGAGRPRDPEIDQRILDAARAAYVEQGWAGFTFVTVARAAGVSRDALYRRYPSLEALLHAVLLNERSLALDLPEAGDPVRAVEEFALRTYDYFSMGDGYIALRVHVESHRSPEVYKAYQRDVLDPAQDAIVESFADLFVRQGVDTGAFDLRALVESITGAAMMHALLNQATDEDTSRAVRARELVRVQVRQILAVTGLAGAGRREPG